MTTQDFQGIIEFLVKIGRLKEMQRRGWVLREVKNPESIADHTFRMAIMAWLLAKDRPLDMKKLIKMALVHDVCEVYAGDMTPYDDVVEQNPEQRGEILAKWRHQFKSEKEQHAHEKRMKEKASLDEVVRTLPEDLKSDFQELWFEYEEGSTREGKFLRQVDRIENVLQALEYRERGEAFSIAPWWEQLKEITDDSELLEFVEALGARFEAGQSAPSH